MKINGSSVSRLVQTRYCYGSTRPDVAAVSSVESALAVTDPVGAEVVQIGERNNEIAQPFST